LEKYVVELCKYLPTRNVPTKIVYKMGKLYNPLQEGCGNEVLHVQSGSAGPFPYLLKHLPNPLTIILSTKTLFEELRINRNKKPILHAHDISSSLFVAAFVSKIFRLPIIVQVHGFPLLEQRIKLEHDASHFAGLVWFLSKLYHNLAVKLIIATSPIVIVNNLQVKSFFKSCGISGAKLRVVPASIDIKKMSSELLSKHEAKAKLDLDPCSREIVFGYIGGLRPEKNLDLLLCAFSRFVSRPLAPNVRLVIIGDGPQRLTLEKQVKKLKIDRFVDFKGQIPNAFRFLNAIDIFVLTSLSEGSPTSLIEAMASGRSIIASDIPAIREMVCNHKEALLINPHDAADLECALLMMYKDPQYRSQLGHQALLKAKFYDKDLVYDRIVKAITGAHKIRYRTRRLGALLI
jgi:glycosyltransferase involved in cell wall biosynthesis